MSVDTAYFRQLLEKQRTDLETQLALAEDAARPVPLQQESVGRLSRMDAIQQQQMAIATRERLKQQLFRTRQALERIEEGDYGYCLECDNEIPRKRLELDPSIALCVSCAK